MNIPLNIAMPPGACAAPFSLAIEGVLDALRVVRFTGHEEVSRLYEFRVEIAAGELDLAQVVGRQATLELDGAGPPRLVHGVVAGLEYTGESRRWQLYTVTLVPRAWRLLHRRGCRVFQNKTTAEVVAAVLRDAGFPRSELRFDLTATYAPRNYCVQYRESDLAFISRLLEEDGIFYFFEHGEARTTMVFADHPEAHPPIAGEPVVWFHPGGALPDREHVTDLRVTERVQPGTVSLRDFNFQQPAQAMDVDAAARRDTDLEVYDYPGDFQDPGAGGPHQGRSMAKIRLEELQALRRRATGSSDCMRLVPGHAFAVQGHRRAELNQAHVLIRVTHEGSQPQALDEDGVEGEFFYRNSFECIDRAAPFRPRRITPRPVVQGVQSATVVGPAQEEIHVDEHGRVLVQFHWDRHGSFDERSSCWVRVSQAWAGAGWGAMFIPRVGHEVLVDFLEGDPDRPIITGRVYHADNPTPYPLPDEKTKSTIRSESSPGGGGFNELRFEDRKGAEEVFIHAQRDLREVVLHDNNREVGADQRFTVGGDQSFTITGDRSVTVTGGDESLTVRAGKSTTVVEHDRSVTVTRGNSSLNVKTGTHTLTAKQELSATSLEDQVRISAFTSMRLAAGTEDLVATAARGVAVTAETGTLALLSRQDASLTSQQGALSLSGKKDASLVSTDATLTLFGARGATLTSSEAIRIDAFKRVSVGGRTVDVHGKKITLTADDELTLQVGASTITLKADGITLSAPKINSTAIGLHEISGALIKIN